VSHHNSQTITVTRGLEYEAEVNPEVPAGDDITTWGIRFRIRRRVGAAALVTLTVGAGLTVADPDTLRIKLTPDQTEALGKGDYVWDLERTDPGFEFQMAGGPFIVEGDEAAAPALAACPPPAYAPVYGKLYDAQFRNQRPTVVVPSGSPAAVRLDLLTGDGRPAAVTAGGYCGSADTRAAAAEAVGGCVALAGASLDDGGATVTVELPETVWRVPGVYELDVRVDDANAAARAQARCWVYVEPNAFGVWHQGPPRVDDVRAALRDYPQANRLLGGYEFSTTEIAVAVVQAVRGFNTAPPGSVGRVTTSTWHRDAWNNLIDGVMAELFDTAAAYYRRNHLLYQAGGVSVDDANREKDYLAAAYVYRERWEKWVKLTKMAINMEDSFGSMLTDYSW
jgi:hypothetical protein